MIIGVDVGYSYTKDNTHKIFKSAMSKEESAVSGAMKVMIDNETYFVGVGQSTTDVLKFGGELSKVLLLTDLWLNGANEYKIVTGLPIEQFRAQKENYMQAIKKYEHTTVNGRVITIKDVTIFPQAAGSLYSMDIKKSCVVCDVGGRTTDIGLFEYSCGKFTLVRSSTLYCGMEALYSDIVKSVNNHYSLSLENWQGESILKNGLTLDGEHKDTAFLTPVVSDYFEPVCRELELKYPIRTVDTLATGGGAYTIKEPLKVCAPVVKIMVDSQFSNANGFFEVGVSKYVG